MRDLADGTGWGSEYPRDVWLLRRPGYPSRDARIRFDRIERQWLRELTRTLDPAAAADRHRALHRRS